MDRYGENLRYIKLNLNEKQSFSFIIFCYEHLFMMKFEFPANDFNARGQ